VAGFSSTCPACAMVAPLSDPVVRAASIGCDHSVDLNRRFVIGRAQAPAMRPRWERQTVRLPLRR
jgi:hypothetical protein